MAIVTSSNKACSSNPLKMSQPIGGSFAFLGLRGQCRSYTVLKAARPLA